MSIGVQVRQIAGSGQPADDVLWRVYLDNIDSDLALESSVMGSLGGLNFGIIAAFSLGLTGPPGWGVVAAGLVGGGLLGRGYHRCAHPDRRTPEVVSAPTLAAGGARFGLTAANRKTWGDQVWSLKLQRILGGGALGTLSGVALNCFGFWEAPIVMWAIDAGAAATGASLGAFYQCWQKPADPFPQDNLPIPDSSRTSVNY